MNKFLTVLIILIIVFIGYIAFTYHNGVSMDYVDTATTTAPAGDMFPIATSTATSTGSSAATSSAGTSPAPAGSGSSAGTGSDMDTGGLPSNTETDLRIGQSVNVGGFFVTIDKVLEDSRCPKGVQCIQAGRVAVSINVTGTAGPATYTLATDKPVLVENKQLVLSVISPDKAEGMTINPADYRFGLSLFEVSKSQ